MDLRYSADEEQFRADLRAWLAATLPTLPAKPSLEDWPARRSYDTHWQRLLFDAGYAGIAWPTEYGGRGATPTEQLIFLEESERAGAPYVGVNFVGLLHAGPTLIAEGSDEQRARYLPPILRGEEVWCQGFSEPGAGSDLAALSTRAVRDGDHYVVTGHKVWTSHAEVADHCELLVRTDSAAPKHRGITWLVMPMDSAGIDVRPLRTILGSAEFSEMYLDDVRIPIANRIGEENDGWRVAMVTFSFERGTAFVGDVVNSQRVLGELAALARETGQWGDAGLRRELGHIGAELDALWALIRRNVSEATRSGVPGVGGSVFKLRYSEVRQQLMDLSARLRGRGALDLSEPYVEDRLSSLNLTIAAGTSQIQRNIIGERILGLPRER